MCEFRSLYFKDDGYVVCYKQCGCYQVAFGSSMLNLTPQDFIELYKRIRYICADKNFTASGKSKNVVIPTSAQGVYILLTEKEVDHFSKILEAADNEMKAQYLMSLFKAE